MSAPPYTGPGWYLIDRPSPSQPAGSTRVVFIDELPEDTEWPMPRRWLGCWLTAEARFTSLAVIRGELELVESMIVDRIGERLVS